MYNVSTIVMSLDGKNPKQNIWLQYSLQNNNVQFKSKKINEKTIAKLKNASKMIIVIRNGISFSTPLILEDRMYVIL